MTVIPVGDVERSLRFWVRGLGLTMADEITEEGKITGYMVSGVFVRDHGHTEFFLTDEDGYFHCFGVVTEEMENPK